VYIRLGWSPRSIGDSLVIYILFRVSCLFVVCVGSRCDSSSRGAISRGLQVTSHSVVKQLFSASCQVARGARSSWSTRASEEVHNIGPEYHTGLEVLVLFSCFIRQGLTS
jgi:hypothetical protein